MVNCKRYTVTGKWWLVKPTKNTNTKLKSSEAKKLREAGGAVNGKNITKLTKAFTSVLRSNTLLCNSFVIFLTEWAGIVIS